MDLTFGACLETIPRYTVCTQQNHQNSYDINKIQSGERMNEENILQTSESAQVGTKVGLIIHQ